MSKVGIEDVLPVSIVDAPVIANKYGDLCFAFAYQGPEMFSCPKEKYLDINTIFESGINFLDDSYVIHKQDVFLQSVYKGSDHSDSESFITKSFYNHFKNKIYFKNYGYLFVIKMNGFGLNRKYDIHRTFTEGQSKTVKAVSAAKNIDLVRESIFAYAHHLKSAGIKLQAVQKDEEIYKLMDGYLSGYDDGALSDLLFSKDGIIIGTNKKVGIMSVNSDENLPSLILPYAENPDYSRRGNDNVLYSDLLNSLGYGLKADHIVNTIMFLDGQKFWKQDLEKKSKTLKSMAAFGKSNSRMSEDNDLFLEATYAQEGQKVVRCHVNIMFWSDDQSSFQGIASDIKSRFIGLGIVPHVSNYLDQKSLFLSCFPGNAGTMPFEETFVTHGPVACSLFIKESVIDRSKGRPETHGLLYTDRASNIPAYRDSFRIPYATKAINSRNVLVVGESGGGKSSSVIEILRQYHELGFDITAIDIGRSFEIFAKTYNGNYIVYEDGMSLGINPFQITDGALTVDRLEYLSSFIPVLWDPQREFTTENISAIEKLIIAFYGAEKTEGTSYKIGIDGNCEISDFYKFVDNNRNIVKDITKGRDVFFDIDSFLLSMERYISGKFDALFKTTGGSIVDPTKSLTCFELDNIKDHPVLFPIFSMLITHMSTEVLWKKRNSEKIFWFDEAWKVLEKPGMASLLKYLYKTVRKFDGAVGINIQTIGDLKVPFGNIEETILGNSPVKHIMKHKEELVAPIIKKLFGDDSTGDYAKSLLRSINSDLSGKFPFTEHLHIVGDDMKIMKMMVSPYQRVNFMSEFKDKEVFFAFEKEEGGNMEKAFKRFVEFKKW